jgi:hypothetical protein
MPRRFLLVSCLLGLVLVAGGCGTSSDRDQARDAAQALYAAVDRHDGTSACAQMSPSLRSELVGDEGRSCPKAVLDLRLAGATADRVVVYADAALVRLAGGDTVFLSDTHLGWRVDALGCRPAGKGPYDCEAQS